MGLKPAVRSRLLSLFFQIIATGGKVIIPQKCPENESLSPEEQDRNAENVSIAASSQKENDRSDEISNVSDTW